MQIAVAEKKMKEAQVLNTKLTDQIAKLREEAVKMKLF